MRSYTWILVLILIISLVDVVMATWNRVCTPFTKSFGPHPYGICGNRIDELLDVLCIGGYNEYPNQNSFRRKRDISEGIVEVIYGHVRYILLTSWINLESENLEINLELTCVSNFW